MVKHILAPAINCLHVVVKDEHDRLMSQKTSLEQEKYALTEGLDEDPELKK